MNISFGLCAPVVRGIFNDSKVDVISAPSALEIQEIALAIEHREGGGVSRRFDLETFLLVLEVVAGVRQVSVVFFLGQLLFQIFRAEIE